MNARPTKLTTALAQAPAYPSSYEQDLERVRSALSYISADDRDTWVKVGMAIKDEFGDAGFCTWDEWGQKGEGHNALHAKSTWKSFKKKGVGIATFIYIAKENGWIDSGNFKKPTAAELEQRKRLRVQRDAEAQIQEAAQHEAAAVKAEGLVQAAQLCAAHPYLDRKGVQPHGVLVGPWQHTDSKTGEVIVTPDCLLIPLSDRHKKVHSLQFIMPDGTKRFLPGGAKAGHFYSLGKPQLHEDKKVFVLAEGFATAASVHEATGHMVLCCFDTSNLLPVALALRARQPDAIIVFAADNDLWTSGNPGMKAAQKAADAVGGLVCAPAFTEADQAGLDQKGAPTGPTDWNDWAAMHGADSVASALAAALDAPPPVATAAPLMAPKAPGDDESDELGIIILGVNPGRRYFFWRCDTAKVEVLTGAELGKHQGLQRLADMQRWELWAGGNFTPTLASNFLINKAMSIGAVDLARVPQTLCPGDVVRREYLLAVAHTCGKRPAPAVIAEMLTLDPGWTGLLAFDELSLRPVVLRCPPCGGPVGHWTDEHDTKLAGWLHTQYELNLSANLVAEVVGLLAGQNRCHPVRQYLNALQWDGTLRLDTWLIDHAEAVDTLFVRAASAKSLIAAVARVFKPGCKADTALVLEGPQGAGKSSFLRALMPDAAWFSEDLGGPIGKKDAMEGLAGKWIIELAEIAAMKKSSAEDVKSFLSRQVDSFRVSYGRRSEDHPRQCVFFGTVNPGADGAWLNDATGGRRFWPVKVERCNVPGITGARDQLWAEAAHRYHAGEPHFLPPEIEKLAAIEQQDRLEENPWDAAVDAYFSALCSPVSEVTTYGIFNSQMGRMAVARDAADLRRIASALRARGWSDLRKGSRRSRVWTAPVPEENEPPI